MSDCITWIDNSKGKKHFYEIKGCHLINIPVIVLEDISFKSLEGVFEERDRWVEIDDVPRVGNTGLDVFEERDVII